MEVRKLELKLLEQNKGQIDGVPKNPRKWTQTDIDRLARSIEETPELLEARRLIVIPHEKKFVVLGGNLRLVALKQMKWAEAPCIVLPQETTTDKMKEIVAKDNASFGEWDIDLLKEDWGDLPLGDWGVPEWEEEVEEETEIPNFDTESKEREKQRHICPKCGFEWES